MKFASKILSCAVAASAWGGGGADAQAMDNIDGTHTAHSGDHYADCTSSFCFSGPNWGDNGQFAWYVKVTFSQSAATYGGTSCFDNTVEYYDWNKLWGKARCGYSHNHQQDSDRFVWRRLQDLHSSPNCGGLANCTGIQLGTYSYDAGTTPYPNENWDLSKTFSTVLQPGVPYVLGMESFADGTVLHSLSSSDGTMLESKTNVHSNHCGNYEQGSVLGLYFGGTCTAPQDVTVVYEAMDGPPGPSDSPTRGPSRAPTGSPTSAPTGIPVPTAPPTTPAPTMPPTNAPTNAPVDSVDKYICAKNDPGIDEICATGAVADGQCPDGSPCGNGRKTCHVAPCPGGGPPGPTPPPPPATPPPTPGTCGCPVCGNGACCCPDEGTCSTSGKPSNRACVSN